MFATKTRTILTVFVLSLVVLGPAARPARAQALPRPVVLRLIRIRIKQAFAVEAQIVKTQKFLARLQEKAPISVPIGQAITAQEQALLAAIQAQINLLVQLLIAEDEAEALYNLIQHINQQANRSGLAESIALGDVIKILQAALAQVQAHINIIQSQIVPL